MFAILSALFIVMRIITFDLIRIKECKFDSGFSDKFQRYFFSLFEQKFTVGIMLLEELL